MRRSLTPARRTLRNTGVSNLQAHSSQHRARPHVVGFINFLASAGAITFGPEGILFAADNDTATIFAIDVQDAARARPRWWRSRTWTPG
jgi:hypothetical protein